MQTFAKLPYRVRMRYEAAEALGLKEKLLQGGWGGLTAEETGRVGVLVRRRIQQEAAAQTQ